MNKRTVYGVALGVLMLSEVAAGQAAGSASNSETHHYAIEVAGIRVGTMTATRQNQPDNQTTYTLISDVKVNFLIYKLKVYYKVVNRVQAGKLLLSTVDARTNKGTFGSRTEWKSDHYDIESDQYKHQLRSTEARPILYTVTHLFFAEPQGQSLAFAEYFGDYFTLNPTAPGHYNAQREGRTDEYVYENGRLVKIIKKNPLKNFLIRFLD